MLAPGLGGAASPQQDVLSLGCGLKQWAFRVGLRARVIPHPSAQPQPTGPCAGAPHGCKAACGVVGWLGPLGSPRGAQSLLGLGLPPLALPREHVLPRPCRDSLHPSTMRSVWALRMSGGCQQAPSWLGTLRLAPHRAGLSRVSTALSRPEGLWACVERTMDRAQHSGACSHAWGLPQLGSSPGRTQVGVLRGPVTRWGQGPPGPASPALSVPSPGTQYPAWAH